MVLLGRQRFALLALFSIAVLAHPTADSSPITTLTTRQSAVNFHNWQLLWEHSPWCFWCSKSVDIDKDDSSNPSTSSAKSASKSDSKKGSNTNSSVEKRTPFNVGTASYEPAINWGRSILGRSRDIFLFTFRSRAVVNVNKRQDEHANHPPPPTSVLPEEYLTPIAESADPVASLPGSIVNPHVTVDSTASLVAETSLFSFTPSVSAPPVLTPFISTTATPTATIRNLTTKSSSRATGASVSPTPAVGDAGRSLPGWGLDGLVVVCVGLVVIVDLLL